MLVCVLVPSIKITDASEPMSWVNVEIPYFGADSILVKMTVVTVGNHLGQPLHVLEIEPDISSTSTNGTMITASVNILVWRGVLEVEYSADSNTTRFTYTVSRESSVTSFGVFPNDEWRIVIKFETDFQVEFDAHTKYCSVPSPNYYAKYNTTQESSDTQRYTLNLTILHPPSFANYVWRIFYLPIALFGGIFLFLFIVLVYKRKEFGFSGIYTAICSAIIVFLPIFHLSFQGLETPFTITLFDDLFIILLVAYTLLLIAMLSMSSSKGKKEARNDVLDY